MGEIDAAGDIVTAGLIGRAVEPHAGEGAHGTPHGDCLNCGTVLVGEHCHACGQSAHVHRSMSAYGHDILHGVFHFEGKIWRTLPMLAFRPGELTRRYVAGERARFVSPIALFLFSVFLMFTVVANLPGWNFGNSDMLKPGVAQGMAKARTQLAEARAQAQKGVVAATERLAGAKADTPVDPDKVATAERRLARAQKALNDTTVAEKAIESTSLPNIKATAGSSGGAWIEQKYRHATENPQLLIYKIKTTAYKFSWALIPISLPFIWLLFPFRRDVGMYDHAIFATYSLTFMSLLTIVLAVLGAVGVPGEALFFAAMLIPPLHMYRQLKGAYGLSRAGTIWRLFWLLNFTAWTSTLFVLLLLYLGVAD
ncbi:MAG: DUF3667 domain-containing protein [Pseudomonadota bacterium]